MGKKNLFGLIGLVAILLVIPHILGNPYYLGVLVWCGIYSLVCMGLSLFMGYCGQISLGHAGFCALGAYISAILTTRAGFSPWTAILIAVVASSLVALGVGLPTLRLKGHYLAMATLGFGTIVYVVADANPFDLTGGPSGLWQAIPRLSLFGLVIKNELQWYYFVWAVVLMFLILLLNIVHSRMGRALRSIHGGEQAARAMGVNAAKFKIETFMLSAALGSIAGSFYAHYVLFVNPEPFSLVLSIHLVTMVVIGGMTNLWGTIAGVALLTILTRYFHAFRDWRLLLDGFLLIIIMLLFPQGLFVGAAKRLGRMVSRRRARKLTGRSREQRATQN
jgi:branched-chain amino acid transport system permease protein